ncbi:MAG: hypothetical protein ACOZNI_35255 [Myxococcota bacterium]
MLSLLAEALAGSPRITAVGEPIPIESPGNWPRIFPRADGGWDVVTADTDSLVFQQLDGAFGRINGTERTILDGTDLIDHTWATCPDGTRLHVGMGSRRSEQHTAEVRHFSAAFELLHESVAIDDDEHANIVDQAVICGDAFRGFPYLWIEEELDGFPRFVDLDEDGEATGEREFRLDDENPLYFSPVGVSLLERGDVLWIFSNDLIFSTSFHVVAVNEDLEVVRDELVAVTDAPSFVFWPQGVVDVAGHTFLVYVKQDDRAGWVDSYGDLEIAHFDEDMDLVETVPVLEEGPGGGGFQPWLAYRDGELVVMYTADGAVNAVIPLTVDEDAPDPVDTGDPQGDDTGEPPDTDADTDAPPAEDDDDPPREPVEPTRTCGVATPVSAGALFLALALGRRRRP